MVATDGHVGHVVSSFSLGSRCVGQFGGCHRKNTKFLTYSISKLEKDQTVTKINDFSIVFWWPQAQRPWAQRPWAQWPQRERWSGEGPG